MGNYIYALRSPRLAKTAVIRTQTGEQVTALVGSMCYLFRPSYSHRSMNEPYHRVAARLEKLWSGKTIPALVAFTHEDDGMKIRPGMNVYSFSGFATAPIEYNDGSELRKLFGTIERIV